MLTIGSVRAVFLGSSAAAALREPLSAIHIYRKHPKYGTMYLNWTVASLRDNDVLMIQNHDEFFEAANDGTVQAFRPREEEEEDDTAENGNIAATDQVPNTLKRRIWLLVADPYSSRCVHTQQLPWLACGEHLPQQTSTMPASLPPGLQRTAHPCCRAAMAITYFIALCILLSAGILLAESLPRYKDTQTYEHMQTAGTFFNIIFTLEFLVRIATCQDYRAYMKDMHNWIDVLALFPFYVEQVCLRS